MLSIKEKRLRRIMKEGRCVLLAFDHAVEHGPHKYEGVCLDPLRIASIADKGKADALIVHIGTGRIIKENYGKIPFIIKVTGRTSLSPTMVQEIVTTVDEAIDIGAIGIAATVYVGSSMEYVMLRNLAEIKLRCLQEELPLFAFMYPRVNDKKTTNVNFVRYAARLGAELGVDVVKTYYTGSKESFERVVKECFVPLLVAGGIKTEREEEFLKIVKDAISAGASGIAVGRNVWMRDDAIEMLRKIREIVVKK
ncbi:MAG TPA: hypothetical protein ENG45_01890 [Candidatus Aenigmarchaeota archaeon]|nr:hypothetical protein [Candidatus Aenigmarchaeota archaeon]